MATFKGLNVGCGPYRTDLPGWINTDVIRLPGNVEPDVVVTPEDPLPFDDSTFDRIYMGHVLEHVPWEKTVGFLELVRGILKPEGELLVVCPDVNRALDVLLAGSNDRQWYIGVLEDDVHAQGPAPRWFGARHCWNAYEDRLVRVVSSSGYEHVRAVDVADVNEMEGWPVVSTIGWQCAVKAVSPSAGAGF